MISFCSCESAKSSEDEAVEDNPTPELLRLLAEPIAEADAGAGGSVLGKGGAGGIVVVVGNVENDRDDVDDVDNEDEEIGADCPSFAVVLFTMDCMKDDFATLGLGRGCGGSFL